MATLEQLKTALVNAHDAGDTEAATALADEIVRMQKAAPSTAAPTETTTPPAQDYQRTPAPGFIDYNAGVGIPEAVLNFGTGLVGQVASGYRGLYGLATGESPEQSAQNVQKWQQALTYQPRTKAGQVISEYNPLALTGRGIQWLGGKAGEATQQLYSGVGAPPEVSAGLATVADVGTQALGTILTGKAAPAVVRGTVKAGQKVATKIPFTEARMQAKVSSILKSSLNNDPVLIQKATDLLSSGKTIEETAAIIGKENPDAGIRLAATAKSVFEQAPSISLPRQGALIEQAQQRLAPIGEQILSKKAEVNTLAETRAAQLKAEHQAELDAIEKRKKAELERIRSQKLSAIEKAKLEQEATRKAAEEMQAAQNEASQKFSEALSQQIEGAPHQEVGNIIVQRRNSLEQTAKNEVSAGYKPLYDKNSAANIDFSQVEQTARRLGGEANAIFNPQLAPLTSDVLSKYQTKTTPAQPAVVDASGMLRSPLTPEISIPPKTNLEGAHELLQAINKDDFGLRDLTQSDQLKIHANLTALRNSVMSSLEKTLSKEDFAAFKKQQTEYRTKVIEPFREGWIADVERTTSNSNPVLFPSDIVNKILSKPEHVDKFISTFGKDADSIAALKSGINTLFKDESFTNGVFNENKYNTFVKNNRNAFDKLKKAGIDVESEFNIIADKIKTNQKAIENVGRTTQARIEGAGKVKETKIAGAREEAYQAIQRAKEDIASLKNELENKKAGSSSRIAELNAADEAKINELIDLFESVSENKLPSAAEKGNILELTKDTPGLAEEINRIRLSDEFEKMASAGKKAGYDKQVVKEAASQGKNAAVNAVLGLVNWKLPLINYTISQLAKKFGVDFVSSHEKLVMRIAKTLADESAAAKALSKNTKSTTSTNALRPQ